MSVGKGMGVGEAYQSLPKIYLASDTAAVHTMPV